jgi:hypothetical protein
VAGTVGDYLAAKERLYRLFDGLFAALAARGSLGPEATAEFSALLGKLMEPGLGP